jgi:single-strand DNA-binding protein
MYLNQLTIIGFTGQDADFHFSSNGILVTILSVATKESWKDAAGDWQSHTDWHRIVAFGKLAEYAKTLTKGTHVMVQGLLRSREYEKDGVSRRVSEVRAKTIANWIVANAEKHRNLLSAERCKRTAPTARFSQK